MTAGAKDCGGDHIVMAGADAEVLSGLAVPDSYGFIPGSGGEEVSGGVILDVVDEE